MIAPPEFLVQLFKPWADFYGQSKVADTIVTFMHVAGLLLAGGMAVSMDRATFRALRRPAGERADHLAELAALHPWVLTGLGVIVASGAMMLAADIETYYGSWIYWTKMALVVALLVNGFQMTRAEQDLRADATETATGWEKLHRTSKRSTALWFTIALLGVALTNLA
jgi:hypothetical protein